MSTAKYLVKHSLEYYDKNCEKYERILSKIEYYELLENESDLERNIIIFYDKDKKEIFRSRYETLGLYDDTSKTWIWAWSIPYFKKNSVYMSRKILNYGLDIEISDENKFLKTELVTSRFRISNHIQLDIHVSIASYLSKIPMIYNLAVMPTPTEQYDVIKKTLDVSSLNKGYQFIYMFLLDFDKL